MIRRRGGSLSLVHTHRGGGRLRTDHLATLGRDGRLTAEIQKAAEEKARSLGIGVEFDWSPLQAQAEQRAAEAEAYRAERGLRRKARADTAREVADLEERLAALEAEVESLRAFAREAVEVMQRHWEVPSSWTRRGRFSPSK